MTKNFKSLIAIIFLSLFLSCRTIKVFDYLKVTENQVQTYNSFWVIGREEMVRKVPAPKLPEGMASSVDYGSSDTVYASFKVIYKHIVVDGEKIVYALSAEDTMRSNPSVGPNHFLSSAMIFKKNSLLLAPIYRLEEISKLNPSDFNTKIPHKIFKKDSIIVRDKKKTIILSNFSLTSIMIGKIKHDNCLSFIIKEDWPESIYFGKVWISKKYGILKWRRFTGRTETRNFSD